MPAWIIKCAKFLGGAVTSIAGFFGVNAVIDKVTDKNQSNGETTNTVTSVFDIEGLLITLAVAGVITLIIYLIKRRK